MFAATHNDYVGLECDSGAVNACLVCTSERCEDLLAKLVSLKETSRNVYYNSAFPNHVNSQLNAVFALLRAINKAKQHTELPDQIKDHSSITDMNDELIAMMFDSIMLSNGELLTDERCLKIFVLNLMQLLSDISNDPFLEQLHSIMSKLAKNFDVNKQIPEYIKALMKEYHGFLRRCLVKKFDQFVVEIESKSDNLSSLCHELNSATNGLEADAALVVPDNCQEVMVLQLKFEDKHAASNWSHQLAEVQQEHRHLTKVCEALEDKERVGWLSRLNMLRVAKDKSSLDRDMSLVATEQLVRQPSEVMARIDIHANGLDERVAQGRVLLATHLLLNTAQLIEITTAEAMEPEFPAAYKAAATAVLKHACSGRDEQATLRDIATKVNKHSVSKGRTGWQALDDHGDLSDKDFIAQLEERYNGKLRNRDAVKASVESVVGETRALFNIIMASPDEVILQRELDKWAGGSRQWLVHLRQMINGLGQSTEPHLAVDFFQRSYNADLLSTRLDMTVRVLFSDMAQVYEADIPALMQLVDSDYKPDTLVKQQLLMRSALVWVKEKLADLTTRHVPAISSEEWMHRWCEIVYIVNRVGLLDSHTRKIVEANAGADIDQLSLFIDDSVISLKRLRVVEEIINCLERKESDLNSKVTAHLAQRWQSVCVQAASMGLLPNDFENHSFRSAHAQVDWLQAMVLSVTPLTVKATTVLTDTGHVVIGNQADIVRDVFDRYTYDGSNRSGQLRDWIRSYNPRKFDRIMGNDPINLVDLFLFVLMASNRDADELKYRLSIQGFVRRGIKGIADAVFENTGGYADDIQQLCHKVFC